MGLSIPDQFLHVQINTYFHIYMIPLPTNSCTSLSYKVRNLLLHIPRNLRTNLQDKREYTKMAITTFGFMEYIKVANCFGSIMTRKD